MLDPAFKFSQHSLSDFADCPRRFYLRYVAKQAWPLIESGPFKQDAQEYQKSLWRGTVLHRWIERYWLGVPAQSSDDAELNLWWARFTGTRFDDLPAQRLPELALVAPLGDYLLYARFDLLALDPAAERAVIVDWKTLRGERPPRYRVFAERFQTRIYLYVLATAGAAFNAGEPFAPEKISMRYWLANFPDAPWVDIPYSADEHERDRRSLLALMDDAARREGEEQYEMTPDESKCSDCTFRTLCRRRTGEPEQAAPDQWLDAEETPELDY